MARNVRNVLEIEESIEESSIEGKAVAAIYARKSLEDKDSLDIQIGMLEEYVKESEDMQLYQVYSDNGYTGTNFERPGFNKLIEDMKLGKFNTIIVKDGSRIGRNYLEAGAYMESIFPSYGIRFISVNDYYDSADSSCKKDGISIPLKNIMNEQYSKDLSRKLTSAFRVRQMSGKFIGGLTTYGYLKDENDKNKLVVDREVAPIIRRIFQEKADGMSDGAIANELNDNGVLSPFAYRFEKGLVKAEKYRGMPWKRGTIVQMLTNKIYLGHMVQGRHRQSLSMHEKKHVVPENEWIIIENTHEAIVDEEVFHTVQEIIKERKKNYKNRNSSKTGEAENLLRGKIYCEDCGRVMEMWKSTSNAIIHRYYRCRLYNETAGRSCSRKTIKKEEIEKLVFETINYHIKLFTNTEKMTQEMNTSRKGKYKREECLKQMSDLKEQRQRYVKLAGGLYEDYEQGVLTPEEYTFLSEEYNGKIKRYEEQLEELRKRADSYQSDFTGNKEWREKSKKYAKRETLNREMVEAFIHRIDVTDEIHIKLQMNSKDEFGKLMEMKERRRLEFNE